MTGIFSPSAWRAAARIILGGDRSTIDTSGLVIPQIAAVAKLTQGSYKQIGTVTYMCFTCGVLIVRPWEVFFVDDDWASPIAPEPTTPSTTTHHAWHMAD